LFHNQWLNQLAQRGSVKEGLIYAGYNMQEITAFTMYFINSKPECSDFCIEHIDFKHDA